MTLSPLRLTSFRVQIAVVFGGLVVAMATLLAVVFGRMMSDSIRAEASNALQVVADNATQVLAEGLQERLVLIQGLAASPTLWQQGLDTPAVRDALSLQKNSRTDVAWLGVVDAQGRVRSASDGLLEGVDVSARPWFAAGLAGPHVGDVHPAKLLATLLPAARSGEPQRFVDFAAPIQQGGKTVGVLAMHGSWDWARSVVESLLPRSDVDLKVNLFIFDHQGTVIYAPRDSAAAYQAAGQRLPAAPHLKVGAAAVLPWADGKRYLTSVVRMQTGNAVTDLGWYVVARTPADVAFEKAQAAVRQIFVLAVVAALIAAVLAWWVAGNLSRPLSAIARAARDVQEGRPGARIPVYRHSQELVRLSESLTGMTRQLVSSNAQLEQRVKERTAELEAANTELHHLTRVDPLTGLLNRRGFEEQLRLLAAVARRTGSALAVMMVDADHFKRVNDTHGHDVGDEVLKTLARVMRERLRESDVIGRLGGEEFVALLPNTEVAGARQLADALVARVAATDIPVVGRVTVSCGVSLLDVGDEDLVVLKRADQALYRAKAKGRNRVAFENTDFDQQGLPD